MEEFSSSRRSRVEIVAEILRELHYIRKRGRDPKPYALEKDLGLQGKRLKDLLADLRRRGLIDDRLKPTERGYAYLQEYSTRILPFLRKYGLSSRRSLRF